MTVYESDLDEVPRSTDEAPNQFKCPKSSSWADLVDCSNDSYAVYECMCEGGHQMTVYFYAEDGDIYQEIVDDEAL